MDEFYEVQQGLSKPGTRGWWERFQFSPEQAEALDKAGRDGAISHRTISIVLGRWGFEVSPVQVGHWRRTVLRESRR